MENELQGQLMMLEVSEIVHQHQEREYKQFTDKFKPAKTTDDCYTPQNIYDCIADWVEKEYGYERSKFLRPFKPDGDYQRETYPDSCAVVDNPPFSILAQICGWYQERGIPFFLFGPTLTLIGNLRGDRIRQMCVLLIGNKITYENGAAVNTSYVTNMDRRYVVRIEPELRARLEAADMENQRANRKELPKYEYPPHVLTGGGYTLGRWGQTLRIERGQAVFVPHLDAQKEAGKSIFGGGLLLSEKAAAEKAAAEKAAAEKAAAEKLDCSVWALSEREKRIIERLGRT